MYNFHSTPEFVTPTPDPWRSMLRRGARRLVQQQRVDGGLTSPCLGRIMESLLVLRLLDRLDAAPGARARLQGYLARAAGDPADVTAPLAARFLARRAGARPDAPLPLPGDFDGHHTASRKRLYFGGILAELGLGQPEPEPVALERFDYLRPTHQSWTRVILCALRVLHAHHTGRAARVGAAERRFLLEHLDEDGLYEHNVFCGGLALLALARLPGARRAARRRAVRLLRHQRADGSFPFFSVEIDVFATALAGLALGAALPLLGGVRRREAAAALRRMVAFIAGQQQASGGWSYAGPVVQTDVDDTAYCTQLLARHGDARHGPALRRAARFLEAMQGADGGWPTYLAGQPSECAMTAGALEALALAGSVAAAAPEPDRAARLRRGVGFLAERQRDDGTFGRSWSLSEANGIFRALHAVRAVERCLGERPPAAWTALRRRARAYLALARRPDGGWGQRVGSPADATSTAYALLGLGPEQAGWVPDALSFLGGCQRADGSMEAPSDQLGPRPLVWTTPVVGDSVAVLAMARGAALLQAPSRRWA